MKRFIPHWPFPSYAFLPGLNPHPKKSGGHMEGEGDPVTEPLDPEHPERSDFLKFSLDLYNFGYYWESHVYLESLWNAHKRTGPVADFLKALIIFSAGHIKENLGQNKLAEEHFARAREILESIGKDTFLGFDLSAITPGSKLEPRWPSLDT